MSQRQKILIVDDEPDIRELLEITLGRMKLDTRSARNVKEAQEWLAREAFDLCLTDMRLPDGNGLELVQHIQKRHNQVPVAMITAHGSLDTAIHALKAGAFDFLTKPVDLTRLRELVTSALRLRIAPAEDNRIDHRLLGSSPPMQALRKQIAKLARSQAPIYISGESGSGKELVARLIHEQGPRAEQSFVPVNCGAIPSELMESEFFGHRKGSFTGAHEDKPGLFQVANGGTLFLDEVADLPLAMQVKLLRAIQEKSVRAIGGQQEQVVDVRVLCATHKDLSQEVAAGRLRQDLYFRLTVIATACCAASPNPPESLPPFSRPTRWWPSRATVFPAMCASWKTCWNGHTHSAITIRSISRTCALPSRHALPSRTARAWPTSITWKTIWRASSAN
jgi:two-component system response regulator PilR (NtrC family)